jgi:peptide subunit release factor 1 (eRF1)
MVRSLAARRGVNGPIVSLYLDVDGQRYIRRRDYETELDHLVRQVREGAGRRGASRAGQVGTTGDIDGDLRRIEAWVRGGIDRSRTRGVAVFSCLADEFFEAVELPVPLHNQLSVDQAPRVRQLEAVLERYRRYGVLMIDRQRARILVFAAGELRDRSELFDELPRHDDDGGGWDRDRVRDHAAAVAQRHVRRAAQVAFVLHQQRPLDHLILAGPDTTVRDVERELHSYLRDRVVGRLRTPSTATDDEIRTAASRIEADVERARTGALVNRLRDAIGLSGAGLIGLPAAGVGGAPIGAAGGAGVAGLDAVLRVLGEHRVDTLVVSDGFEAPGWRCRACDAPAAVGPMCPTCRGAMDRVDDVVEDAIEAALGQSCRVAVCTMNADLDVLGRIGAFLRF